MLVWCSWAAFRQTDSDIRMIWFEMIISEDDLVLDVDLDGDEVENTAAAAAAAADDDDDSDDENCGVLLLIIIFDTDCIYWLLCKWNAVVVVVNVANGIILIL